jgi:hypothetical protein
LHVDLMLVKHSQDLLAEGIDVALQFEPLADSIATTRHVRDWPRVLAAPPPTPSRPVAAHACGPVGTRDHLGPVRVSTNWSSERRHDWVGSRSWPSQNCRQRGGDCGSRRRNGYRHDIERIMPSRNGQCRSRPRARGLGFSANSNPPSHSLFVLPPFVPKRPAPVSVSRVLRQT